MGNKNDISNLNSVELVHLLGAGWNLGNTLDAHWNALPEKEMKTTSDQETFWGNPVTTKAMIEKVKAFGFNTIRVPVTWYMFTGPGPEYKIAGSWMDRVQEVVDYVIDSGMFCILNTHHDDYQRGSGWEIGWLRLYYTEGFDRQPVSTGRALNASEKAVINDRVARIWEQIAERFRDYDEYLIFEGLNEPRTTGFNGNTKEVWAEQCNFLNTLNQTYVDTVRASGGKNAYRHLMVTPFFASVGMDPNDGEGRIGLFVDRENRRLRINDQCGRLIASLHYYEPWGFASAPRDSQYFSDTFDLNKSVVSGNISNVLKIINDNFIAFGIPVVMGETGAVRRQDLDNPERRVENHEAERVKWAGYYISKLKELGVPSVIWDDGGAFRLFDRRNLGWFYPDLAAALVEASKTPIK
ncbi:MAG: glycoside hydrolase family 5 protein [Treponema sp.]|jgi:endoglucanase|nr:glycoside hydrolase family 5 protein [Treponema sp.]